MKLARRILISLLFLSAATAAARAQALPDLSRQDAWTEADKKVFLKYIESSQPMPAGQVKYSSGAAAAEIIRPARYVSVDLLTDSVVPVGRDGRIGQTLTDPGLRALVGTHLLTWVRAYTGLEYNPLSQSKLDGSSARLERFQVPAEFEFALIPLGLEQTRNVLLRAGAALQYIGGAPSSDFAAPVTGLRTTWNVGLGYELQLPDTPWRIHALVEGYRSMFRQDGTDLYGLDISVGAAYTF